MHESVLPSRHALLRTTHQPHIGTSGIARVERIRALCRRPSAPPPSPASPARLSARSPSAVVCHAKGFGSSSSTVAPSQQAACPCGSELRYQHCCQRYHDGEEPPQAEALMRARYSAYVKGLVRFVVDSTHPENPALSAEAGGSGASSTLVEDVRATVEKVRFTKLKILETRNGSHDDEAFVSFQTWLKVRGQQGQRAQGWSTQSFVEHSRFLRQGGRWLYVDGEQEWKE